MARKRIERGLYKVGDVYEACATPPGGRKARWKTLGAVRLMEARRLRDEWAVEVRSGGIPAAGGRETVRQVGEAFLKHTERLVEIEELRPRTLESYCTGVNLHFIPVYGSRRARSITPEDLIEWHRKQRASGASDWSILARWTAVRGLLAYAARHGFISASPADKLLRRERPGAGEPRQRFLTREEISRLLEHAEDVHDHIATLLFTGLRVMEMLALWWGESDFDAEEMHARYQLSRSGKRVPLKTKAARRDIVLMRTLANALRRRRLAERFSGDQDFIFQGDAPGRPMTYKTFLKRFRAACERAGLEGVTPHALRHTFASMLIAQGHDEQFISEQLGHTKTSTTSDIYRHLFEARRHAADAREALDAEYGGLLRTQAALKQSGEITALNGA